MLKNTQKKLFSPVWTHLTDIVVARAAGPYIYAIDGTKYLDFTCGIGVTNTGHCHPKVVKAAQEQCEKLIHGQFNIVWHEPALELVDVLKDVVPKPLDTFFFSNSGAEAVEASIKLARHSTGKQNIIAFQGSFHGRTIGTMSLSLSKTIYRRNYGPLMSGVFSAPYPYCHHCPIKCAGGIGKDQECCNNPLDQVELLLKQQTEPSETAAIILEPILGEGGYVVPPKSFMKGIRKICDENDVLLIADEVQSGFGRTGKYFAMEHFDVVPDILVMAKGIASGFPLSGIVSKGDLMDKWITGTHGGTYGPNAVSCAAAVATQKVIQEEHLVKNAAIQGEYLKNLLKSTQERLGLEVISDVRGEGLMVGVEFNKENVPTGLANKVSKTCVDNGMLLLTAGGFETMRFIPPLTVNKELIEEGVNIFEKSLNDTLSSR